MKFIKSLFRFIIHITYCSYKHINRLYHIVDIGVAICGQTLFKYFNFKINICMFHIFIFNLNQNFIKQKIKDNDIKILIAVIILTDGVCEASSAILVLVANFYCSGNSDLEHLADFNYCINIPNSSFTIIIGICILMFVLINKAFLEIIGSCFLLIFALLLLLIAGVIYYGKKSYIYTHSLFFFYKNVLLFSL